MKVWAVFVYCTAPGYQGRWIDSQWAVQRAATDRSIELDRVLRAFATPEHKTSVVEMSVVDLAITNDGHGAPSPPPQTA